MTEAVETFEHNGKTVEIHYDTDGDHSNPRNNDGVISTLIQENSNCINVDSDDAYLGEARDWFYRYDNADGVVRTLDREDMMRRYIAMFRPDVAYYADEWSAGDSHGWGYVTVESWTKWMGEDYEGEVTPQSAFEGEVGEYRKWATGEVFGYVITDEDGKEDSCWGFIGEEYALQSARDAAGYTCKHCEKEIMRWVGPVADPDKPSPQGFVHSCCATCHLDVEWGGDGWFHSTIKPWDWPDGKPDHVATISHRHACVDGEHLAETDQTVGSYE